MGTINGTNGDNQFLSGTSGNDTINALAGVDWIIGSTGNDLIDGGDGLYDVIMYNHLTAGVIINNTSSQIGNVGAYRVLKPGGQQDRLVGVEAFHGTQFSDKIYLGRDSYLFAEGGNDEIYVGTSVLVLPGSGNDTIFGGIDSWLDYNEGDGSALQSRGIVAIWNSASSGIVTDDGWGNTDKFFGINWISGSAFSDVIMGNIGNDRMSGVAGHDYLYGNAGADALEGGDGNDMLYGGTGGDYIAGGAGDDSIYGGDGENALDGGTGNDVYFIQSDIVANDRINDAGGDTDVLQVLDSSERDAYRLVYNGVFLVHETMQGHRTKIALDENGIPVIEYLQWIGSEEYGTSSYRNTLRIITDLSNISGRLIAVAGTDRADTIVMPNETPHSGEYWGEIYANGGDDNITLSATIEYITYGGDGNDSVVGNGDMGDFVDGEAGNDTIDGSDGADSLYGGAGDDQLRGGDGNDLLESGATSEDGEDELYGGAGDDTLAAQGVSTSMEGGSGDDLIIGSSGFEDLSYETATSGVFVNLETGLAEDGMGGADTVSGIDQVIGSHFADVLIGDDADNRFQAREGDDTIDGGAGSDLVRYDRELSDGGMGAVAVDLAAGWAIDSWGDLDTLSNIESIRATNGNDSVTGSGADNSLQGEGGNDTLYGGGGFDTLKGGDGNDVLIVSGTAFNLNARGSYVDGGDGDDTLISSQLSSWGSLLTPGLGNNTVIGSIETWNSGDSDDLGLNDLVNVGGVTVVQGLNGSGTVRSHDGRVMNSFQYIQWFQLTDEDDLIQFSDDTRWNGVSSGAGSDTIIGGTGVDDMYYGVETGQGITLDVAAGTVIDPWGDTDYFSDVESFRGSQDSDVMSAIGNGVFVNLEGNGGSDRIFGSSFNDTLYGGTGDDHLFGGYGDDVIDDGVGFDTIDGGLGVDTFTRHYEHGDYSLAFGFDLGRGLAFALDAPNTAAEVFVSIENARISGSYSFALFGSTVGNVLETAGGNDSLYGMAGNDSLISGAGNDTLDGGTGNDSMTGGTGNDTYVVNGSSDRVVELANGGTDLVQSSAATYSLSSNVENLILTGSAAINGLGNTLSNILTGNVAANSISGNGGNDSLTGAAGNDTLDGGAGNDWLFGGAGNDMITDGTGYDTIDGGVGIDTLLRTYLPSAPFSDSLIINLPNGTASSLADPSGAPDILISIENVRVGGDLHFIITGDAEANLLETGIGNDSLLGAAGNDTLIGGVGNDTLDGGIGNDSLTGGDGTDAASYASATAAVTVNLSLATTQATGAAGTDMLASIENLIGSNFNDLLSGTATANQLEGGLGADTLVGGTGADLLYGGEGNDRFVIAIAADLASGEIINGGGGTDELRFTSTVASTLTLRSGVAVDKVAIGTGSAANADASGVVALNVNAAVAANGLAIHGNAGANTINGTGYNDSIDGGLGNDKLVGGTGNDTLYGGLGNDTLVGGAGSDVFVFNTTLNAANNKDLISDFVGASDDIWLAKTVMDGLGSGTGALGSAKFWSGAGAATSHDGDDRIVYNSTTGALYYDADGTGAAMAIQIAQLTAGTALTAADLFII